MRMPREQQQTPPPVRPRRKLTTQQRDGRNQLQVSLQRPVPLVLFCWPGVVSVPER